MSATVPLADDAALARTADLALLAFGSRASEELAHTAGPRHLAFLPPDALELDLGDPQQCDFGDYVLVEKLGQGGMGVVYRAHQRSLDRDVALKLLTAGPWASKDFIERFRREAQSAALLQHPNIVAIHEIGSREDLHFFSMRLVRGTSLARRVAERGALAPIESAKLVRTIAEALDYAHRMGVLHLDLKPGNVLIDDSGEVMVADFGLARRLDSTLAADTDEVSGTPSYMAPEQAQIRTHRLSPATDIYGLGAILYDLLTARPPFLAGTAAETLRRVVHETPEPPSAQRKDVPKDLDAICLKCLAKEPKERYASARALADDLGCWLEGRPVSVRKPSLIERVRLFAKREPRLAKWFVLDAIGAILSISALLLLYAMANTARIEAVAQRAIAEQQRDAATRNAERMKQATQLMAAMFPDEEDDAALEQQSLAAIDWLARNLEDDAARGELIGTLAESLVAARRTRAADRLIGDIHSKLGDDYRRRATDALAGHDTPDSIALAALLAQSLREPADVARADELLRRAWQSAPDDRWLNHLAAMHCRANRCAVPESRERLTQIEPENAMSWVYSAPREPTREQLRRLLGRAARASYWNEYYGRYLQEGVRAFTTSGVAIPAAMQRSAALTFVKGDAIGASVFLAVSEFPLPVLQPFVEVCDPKRSNLDEPGLREDCAAFARLAVDSQGALISNAIGWSMMRRLFKGTDVERDMIERRRRYTWMQEQDLFVITKTRYDPRQFIEDNIRYGEMEAFLRAMEYAGIPRDPPADWVPKNPNALLLPEDRPQPAAPPK